MRKALERLAKWRSVFAGWQLGTRPIDDPECRAVRDHREVTIFLRAEVNAIVQILVDKGICSAEEFEQQLKREAELLDECYRKKFPGIKATDEGIEYDVTVAMETMRGWRP